MLVGIRRLRTRILFKQSFTARMPFLIATSAFGLCILSVLTKWQKKSPFGCSQKKLP